MPPTCRHEAPDLPFSTLERTKGGTLFCRACRCGPNADFWRKHCWHGRFSPSGWPCARVARWRGPNGHDSSLVRAWRACDEHKCGKDVRL